METSTCVHCGRVCGNFSGGFARLSDGSPVCHPNEPGRPDCYHLITVRGEQVGRRRTA